MVVEKFRAIRWHANTAMRRGISGQDSDVHADAIPGQPHEPLHRCALEVRAAGRRIDVHAHTCAHNPAGAVDEIAVKGRMMIRIPFQNRKTATGGGVSVLPGGDGRVDDDLFTRQQIGALFRKRNDDMDIIGVTLARSD